MDSITKSFDRLSVGSEIRLTVPERSVGAIFGRGGVTIKRIQSETKSKIVKINDKPVFIIRGGDAERAKREIESIVGSLKDRNNNEVQPRNQQPRSPFGGRIPNHWLGCHSHGNTVIGGFLLPVKCPLHENFTSAVKRQMEPLWRLKEMFEAAAKFGREVGLVVDLTDTDRYYDPKELRERGVQHMKLKLNIHRNSGVLPFDKIHAAVDKLKSYRIENQAKLVLVHCTHGFNRTGLVIVSYLCHGERYSLTEAVSEFKRSRSGIGIYRKLILEQLHQQYAAPGETVPHCPPEPAWARADS